MRPSVSASTDAGTAPDTGPSLAGFWLRLSAWLVDNGVVVVTSFLLSGILASMTTDAFGVVPPLLLVAGNSIFALGRYGQTVGMAVAGVRVTREDGNQPGYWKAFYRGVLAGLLGLFLGITYIWIAFDPRKQGLHDKLARTLVWRLERPRLSSRLARSAFAGASVIALVILAFFPFFVIPRFCELYMELDIKELPALAQAAVNLSNLISTKWWLVFWPVTLGVLSFLVLVLLGRCPLPRRRALYVMLSLLAVIVAFFVVSIFLPLFAVVRALSAGE